ncbi:hypothetical protein [Symbiobacterium thermophilum]|uniref:Translation initiation factor 2 n=1 Tax=Symbiobacterium thermophilum (strain DSM 24528 / JCM 14929 / IAM 14863 / T) TaxID=292459 RepID=Q67NI6_SYMTH|nr:hypothetical protein [Symbiobacterium thermophilum]BAD40757.1 hypothetical protein STH1772 [Symbiobacterium thermophilum IAM 14863]
MGYDEVQALRDRIRALEERTRLLEERIRGLRTSRRILMNLLAAQERERRALVARLEAENGRLQRKTARFARAVLERNIRIVRLEESLRRQTDVSSG